MGRKKENIETGDRGREQQMGLTNKRKTPFFFLNTCFNTVDRRTVKRHILSLIGISLITKIILFFITLDVFHSFFDLFDILSYFQTAVDIANGQLPYITYNVNYPILFLIPTLLAFIPASFTLMVLTFIYSFQILMVLCDIVTILCIYFIALKTWDEKTAFIAGIVYATAFSTAYFVLTKYDAFPTCLLMVAVLFTVYGMNRKGYLFAALGFFAKIFPAIALPFMVLYNAKSTSVRQELVSAGKIFLLFCLILLLPFILINPDVIRTYFFATGGSVGVYANTATYTLYTYLHDVLHLGITPATTSTIMYALMGIALILLFYIAYADSEKNPITLLKLVACAIFCLVFFTKFHSPQYIVWFTPLLCLLVSDNMYKILLFYVTQVFAYIEFPLMFGRFYTNLEYVNPVGSADWYLTLFFFTIEYLALLILVYLIIRPSNGLERKIGEKIHRN